MQAKLYIQILLKKEKDEIAIINNFLPNPKILNDMEKSSKSTAEAIRKKEKIGIFGDYDVDGASATALLGNFFWSIKISGLLLVL